MTILFESAIRVTLIAAIIALVLLAMRIKTASVLHAVWASVVLLMMLLPVWVAWGPKASLPVLPPEVGQTAALPPPLRRSLLASRCSIPSVSDGELRVELDACGDLSSWVSACCCSGSRSARFARTG